MLATASGLLPVEKRRHPLPTDPMFSDNDIALNFHTIDVLKVYKINRRQGYVMDERAVLFHCFWELNKL